MQLWACSAKLELADEAELASLDSASDDIGQLLQPASEPDAEHERGSRGAFDDNMICSTCQVHCAPPLSAT